MEARHRDYDVLLELFPPHWPDLAADHVALFGPASADDPLPSETAAEVTGRS